MPAADIAAPVPLPNFAAALKERKSARILAIGSSSTAGIGATSTSATYPSQLEAILETALKGVDIQIVSRGVSGEVAEIAAERIPSEVAVNKPDLVLWQLGTNDALARISPEEFEATVRSAIRWLKENKIDIVLVGMQYTPRLARDANYSAIRGSLQRAASAENVLYVRRYDAMRFISQTHANLELLSRDNFHLNDLGYQCMAEHVAHAVIVGAFVFPDFPWRDRGRRRAVPRPTNSRPQGVVGGPVQGQLHLQKRRGRLHEVAERHFSREIFRGAEQQRNRRRQKIIGAGQKYDPRLTLDHAAPFAPEAPQMAAKIGAIAAISLKRVVLFELVPNRRQRVAKIPSAAALCSTLATSGRPNSHMLAT